MSELTERLKAWRERTGITMERAAHLFGVTVSAYTKYERGERYPQPEILKRIERGIA